MPHSVRLTIDEIAELVALKGDPLKCGKLVQYYDYLVIKRVVETLNKKRSFKKLRPYHFKNVQFMWVKGQWKNKKLAYQAIDEWVRLYIREKKIKIEDLPKMDLVNDIKKYPILFRASVVPAIKQIFKQCCDTCVYLVF